MKNFFYGIKSIHHAKEIARKVVNALGGSDVVFNMLIETACAETKCGTYPDNTPNKFGVGICQHDVIGLLDIQQEGEQRHFDIIQKEFGYNIKNVPLSSLADDPLLSFICCRLSYKRVPQAIPSNLVGRAKYWKEYYNTKAGDGTVEHYINAVAECLDSECLDSEWQ